jgi:hypothetical protein
MAIPTQGGLGQASAAQAKPPAQAGGKFDVNAAQAENIEEITKSKPTGLKEKVVDDLGDQREAMNAALLRMREAYDARKNRLFDPVLMQTAAGFLKPTKTGSFGESLGYAAENAGMAAEKESVFQRENQKLEMELLGKEQELRQQLGGDALISGLLGGPKVGGAPAPAGGAVTTPTGALRVPGTTSPVDVATAPNAQQVLTAASQGRIKISDEVLILAERVAPKLLPTLKAIRSSQAEEEKNQIERDKFEGTTRPVKPVGGLTERQMDRKEYAEYQAKVREANAANDEQILLRYYKDKGWLEGNQLRDYKPPKEGEPSTPIPRSKSQSELDAEKEKVTKTAAIRAEDAEKAASRLLSSGRIAFANSNTADDMIGYATNNPRVFEIMNKPGISGSVARAVKEGLNSGNFNVSIPADKILDYKLTTEDLTALQMFAQKSSELQTRGRQLNRTPGEGSMSDFETKLLGGIYALPSDSQRAIILKSQALKAQGAYDRAAAEIWITKSKQPGYDYNDFMLDKDLLALQGDYEKTLKDMRQNNLDLLSPRRGKKAEEVPAPAAPSKPATAPAAPASSAVTPLPQNDPSVPPTHIRDPKTGVIRKKREGE